MTTARSDGKSGKSSSRNRERSAKINETSDDGVAQDDSEVLARSPSPRASLLDILLIVVVGFALGAVLVFVIYALVRVTVGPLEDRSQIILGSVGSAAIYVGVVVATYLLIPRRKKGSWREIGLHLPERPFVLRTFLVLFITLAGIVAVGAVVREFFGDPPDVRGQLGIGGEELSGAEIASIAVTAVIAAPIAEEIIFRGLLLPLFRRRWDFWPSAVATAMIFAATHRSLLVMPTLMVLGFSLAWLRERYDSVYPPILLHALNNGLAILILALAT